MTTSSTRPVVNAWQVAILLAHITSGLLAMTISLPSMQEWGAIFGADQAGVQLTFSAFVVAFGGLQLVYGPLSDRHGRKLILLIGLSLAVVGSLLSALAGTLPALIAARFIQGAGCAAGMVVGRSMVQDLFQGPQRTRVMAYVGMAMGLTPPAGTIIGGQLHVHFGWQANFVLIAAMEIVLLIATWRGIASDRKLQVAGSHWFGDMRSAYARLAREPAFLLYVAILACTTAAFFAFLAGAPIVLGSYGIGPGGVGWYIALVPIAYIAGNYLTSALVKRHGERRLMLLGQLLSLASIGLMLGLAWSGFDSPLAFAMPLMLLGVGHGFLTPTSLSGTVGLFPALAGAAAAVAGLMQQMMGAVAGFTVGLLPLDGPVFLGLLMLGFSACAMAAQLMLRRQPMSASSPASK